MKPFLPPELGDASSAFNVDRDVPYLRMADAFLSASPDFIIVVNRLSQFVYVGAAAARTLGVLPAQMLGKTAVDLGLPSQLAIRLNIEREQVLTTHQALSGDVSLPTATEVRDFEYTLSTSPSNRGPQIAGPINGPSRGPMAERPPDANANSHPRLLEALLSPVFDGDGTALAVLFIARDVTERKRSQEAQRYVMPGARCLLWYADIFEMGRDNLQWQMDIPDMEAAHRFLPLDTRGGEDYMLAWYRARANDDKAASDRYGNLNVRAGNSYQQEFRCLTRDGSVRWLREDVQVDTVVPGKRRKTIGVGVDITDQKVAEEQRNHLYHEAERRASELAAVVQAIPDAVYVGTADGISLSNQAALDMLGFQTVEEMNENIALLSELLQNRSYETGERIPPRELAFAHALAGRACVRDVRIRYVLPMSEVKRITQQVFTLASVHDILTNRPADSGDADTVSTSAVLTRLLGMLAAASNCAIEYTLAELYLPLSKVTSLALVVNQLTTNATKHGGSMVEVSLSTENETATVTIEDNGPGFAGFDLLTKANTGLSLVDNLVRHDLNGSLEFANRKSGGGCVQFRFPLPKT